MARYLQLFFILFILDACSDLSCIDADDFGFSYVNVPAGYSKNKIYGAGVAQYVDWYDSGLTLNGDNLYMIVRMWNVTQNINSSKELSAWCPWLGPAKNPPSLQETCVFLDTCIFPNNESCTDTDQAQIINPPCLLRNGMGLYFAATPRDFNPNITPDVNAQPHLADSNIILSHMGFSPAGGTKKINFYTFSKTNSGEDLYLQTGGFYEDLTDDQRDYLTGGKLYFKILDRYYEDNSGQYIVQIKSGVSRTSSWNPSSLIAGIVNPIFFGSGITSKYISSEDIGTDGLVRIIFDNVIKNSNYQMSVRALLGIYLVYTTIQFLLGGTNISQHRLLMIMVKIIVIAQLLSTETAWSFFNQYLFSFLLNGSSFVMGLVGSVFEGDSDIFSIILAPQIYIKLAALPFAGSGEGFGLGIAYVVCFIMCIFIVLIATFYSLIIYMMCAIMMAMLIMLAPIFLCFVLFDQTKPLFDNWIKALISFSLQTIILVAGIAMISLLIKDQIYKNLGFRACQKVLYNIQTQNGFNTQIVGNQGRTVSLYIWKPVYSTPPKEVPVNMPLPNAHYEVIDSSGNITTSPYLTTTSDIKATYCPPFQCFGERYPSFPYLNPEDIHDAERLKTAWSGSLVSASDIILLLVCSLMMYGYSSKALGIAESITGGISIQSAAQTVRTSGVQNTKTAGNMASSSLNSVAGAAWRGAGYTLGGVSAARQGVGHTLGALSAARSGLSSIGSNATNWIKQKLSKKHSPQDLATDSVEKNNTDEKKDEPTDEQKDLAEKKDPS